MIVKRRRREGRGITAGGLTGALIVTALACVTSPTAQAGTGADTPGPEQISNGTFDTGTAPWWSTANTPIEPRDGALCASVTGGTTNPWDAIVGINNIPLVKGETYRLSFKASATPGHVARALVGLSIEPYDSYFTENPALTPELTQHAYTFTASTETPNGQVAFQLGGGSGDWRFCVDDVSLTGGATPIAYEPDTGPRVRVNQVAYLPAGPKQATLVTTSTEAMPWQLVNAKGATVTKGTTKPAGTDASSGQNVHRIDFSPYRTRGTGFTLVADGQTSRPFDIDPDAYEKLRLDALKFYYTQRSGIAIEEKLRPGYARPAGHVGVAPNQGDSEVPCQAGVCDYSLDVRGGWYDAGDHGKYVVNGGISVWQVLSAYDRSLRARTADRLALRDGTLALPESGNKIPDILDEARWELDFLLRMQVPAGKPLAGMVHHKIHDQNWTGLPLLPSADPQKRELHAPSTAATLNLAAVAAQASRLYRPFDAAFADKALAAAKTAWEAAVAHPAMLAPESDGVGGGTYSDATVTDEFYWAAAELYLATGAKPYADHLKASPLHTTATWGAGAFDWGNTVAAARLDLATVPNTFSREARTAVLAGADTYLTTLTAHPYSLPYAPAGNRWDWGSSSLVLNNLQILGTAFDLTGAPKYRDGVLAGTDFLLGRNALNISFVTGYGEVSSKNQHSRWYAHQLDASLPNPPAGSLAGGPNSGIQDPYAQSKLTGCVGQFCYIDHIESWSTNELTINWNSSLAWVASFVADQS
ncbi:MAG: endoglucanase [Actinomycetota bacterium]|nr:endoglucanase [Actinomycetota bacterium]